MQDWLVLIRTRDGTEEAWEWKCGGIQSMHIKWPSGDLCTTYMHHEARGGKSGGVIGMSHSWISWAGRLTRQFPQQVHVIE